MSPLQLYIESGLHHDLIYRPFFEKAKNLNCPQLSLEELDLKNFLVVLCRLSSYTELKKRFRYYRNVWFICLDDHLSQRQKIEEDHLFILAPGQEESLQTLFEPLQHLAYLIFQEGLEEKAKSAHKELAQQAERYLDLIYNSFKYQLSQGSLVAADEQVDEMSEFFLIRRTLLELESEDELFQACAQSFKRWGIVDFKAVERADLRDLKDDGVDKKMVVAPTGVPQESRYYVWRYKGIYDAKLCFYIYNLMLSLEKFYLRQHRQVEMTSEESLWEQVFYNINEPMVLLSPQADILVHNNEFTRLNILPKDCLGFESGKKVESMGRVWSLLRQDFQIKNSKLSLFVFRTASKTGPNVQGINSGELGIISGSIAHELNNPLGGVLACLSLLELEDDWTDDGLHSLEDMRSGAQRCKDLVEIFLGFSKATPNVQMSGALEKSMEQALNLLRFRMIESGTRVLVDFKSHKKLEKVTNSSVMAMVFYLILNDVMTLFGHQDLIRDGGDGQKKLEVLFEEKNDRISLSFNDFLGGLDKVCDSKLIHHLLEVEGFELESTSQKLTLFRSGLF